MSGATGFGSQICQTGGSAQLQRSGALTSHDLEALSEPVFGSGVVTTQPKQLAGEALDHLHKLGLNTGFNSEQPATTIPAAESGDAEEADDCEGAKG